MRNNSLNYFAFELVVQEMIFIDISYLELWMLFCSVGQNHLCNIGRGHHEVHFLETLKAIKSHLKCHMINRILHK